MVGGIARGRKRSHHFGKFFHKTSLVFELTWKLADSADSAGVPNRNALLYCSINKDMLSKSSSRITGRLMLVLAQLLRAANSAVNKSMLQFQSGLLFTEKSSIIKKTVAIRFNYKYYHNSCRPAVR